MLKSSLLKSRCIEFAGSGGPDVMTLTTRALSQPADFEVVIQVAYAGVNRPDIAQRQGYYPPPPGATDIPGLEVSGTVVATGKKVTTLTLGQQVCALLNGGGYSQFALAHETLCLPLPSNYNLQLGAALPENFSTVWFNMVEKGQLARGDIVLIHGGSSGIGTVAIQVAHRFGARVFTTAGSDDKCRYCHSLGAEKAFNYRNDDFIQLHSLTDGHGADIIIDMVGGDYVQRNISAAAIKGRIISIAFLHGSRADVDLLPMALKQLVLTGSTLRGQPVTEKARLIRSVHKKIWPLLDNGLINPVIDRVFPLAEAAEAHRLMESSQHMGKILLDCSPAQSP